MVFIGEVTDIMKKSCLMLRVGTITCEQVQYLSSGEEFIVPTHKSVSWKEKGRKKVEYGWNNKL